MAVVGEQRRGGAQRSQPLGIAREVHERAEGRDHAIAAGQLGRAAQVADDRLEQIVDAQALCASPRLGEHRRRRIERDHAVAMPRELDRDAAAAGAELDDRAGRALACQHVERDVVVDSGAPAVVERPQALVGLPARCCCSASHTR